MLAKQKLPGLLGLLIMLLLSIPFIAAAQEEVIRVTGIRVHQDAIVLALGETEVVTATVYPRNAADKEIRWEIDDPSIAAVYDQDGVAGVNALAPGTAVLTATTRDGGFRDSCLITAIVLVQTLSLEPADISLSAGDEFQFDIIIVPSDATDQRIEWESTEPAVASIDEDGTVRALKEGAARIIGRSMQDKTIAAYATVTVLPPAATSDPGTDETVTGPARAEPISKKLDARWLLICGLGAVLLAAAVTAIVLLSRKKAAPQLRPLLKGLTGYFAGQTMELTGAEVVMGRDPARAQFVYPPEYETISRKHCAVRFDRHTAQFALEDFSSTGTFLSSGERLIPGSPRLIAPGSQFYLSDPGELFTLELS